MNAPRLSFGKGFFGNARPKSSGAPVYQVNVSNGMPIISNKKLHMPLKNPKTNGGIRGNKK